MFDYEKLLYNSLLDNDYSNNLHHTFKYIEREYNLKYLGHVGNVFSPADIDAAITDYEIVQYEPYKHTYLQGVIGIDPGWGASSFSIVVVYFVDGIIRVAYAYYFIIADRYPNISSPIS